MAVATQTERAAIVSFIENRSRPQRTLMLIVAALAATVFSLRAIAQQALNLWWFRSVSDVPIWRTNMLARVQLGALAFTVTLCVVGTSVWWAQRIGTAEVDRAKGRWLKWYQAKVGPAHGWLVIGAPVLFALWETRRVATKWQVWLLFQKGRSTGIKVPDMGGDVGDYLFKLPFWDLMTTWLSWMLVGAIALSLLVYLVNRRISLTHFVSRSEQAAVAHMSVLLGLLCIVKAVDFLVVQRMSLAMSTSGAFVGAGYTELTVQRTTLYTLTLIGFLVGGICLANVRWRLRRLAVLAAALWGIVAVMGLYFMPGVILRLRVAPQEAIVERPYVENNLEATSTAYSLTEIIHRSLEDAPTPTPSLQVDGSAGSAEGIPARVPLLDANLYAPTFQVLEGRTAVKIANVDTDRYPIDGKSRPVLLGARSPDAQGLPQAGWEQKHLVFTHGDGLAVAPADEVRADGRPDFDILADQIPIKRPELYFGEGVQGWYAIVGTGRAQQNGATFEADTGMAINSLWRRGTLALTQAELDPLFSDYITDDSQLLYRRGINERLHAMAPFMKWGSDPYPVVTNGRITWVIDGFTTASTYPNSQFADTTGLAPDSDLNQGRFNYIRSSVKATIDAYDGTVTMYRTDRQGANDPILDAWSRIYPGLFTPIDEMPAGLKSHLRYSVDLLKVQTQMLGRYHVTDPDLFLDGSRNWVVSADTGSAPEGTSSTPGGIPPVPQVLDTATSEGPRWMTVRPFNLGSAANASSPRAALSAFALADNDDAELLELWTVPNPNGSDRQRQLGGPSVVQAAINGDTELSQQFNLLSAGGSKVSFGAMTLVPNGKDVVYVRPVYVIATGTDATQQLVEVLAYTDGLVGRGATLDEALNNLREPISAVPETPEVLATPSG